MNTYALVLSKSRFPSLITVHSMRAIVLLVLVLLTIVSARARDDDEHRRKRSNDNSELSGVQKPEKRAVVDNDNVVTPPSIESASTSTNAKNNNNNNNSNSNTPAPTKTTGPEITQDKNKVIEKFNCSLEAKSNNVNTTNCPESHSDDHDGYFNSLKKQMIDNKEMLLRTLYVTLGITGIIVVYFVARTVCGSVVFTFSTVADCNVFFVILYIWLRKRRTKSRKYRIIAQNGDQRDLEMEPLGDGNDDDEDYTVFELNGRKK